MPGWIQKGRTWAEVAPRAVRTRIHDSREFKAAVPAPGAAISGFAWDHMSCQCAKIFPNASFFSAECHIAPGAVRNTAAGFAYFRFPVADGANVLMHRRRRAANAREIT